MSIELKNHGHFTAESFRVAYPDSNDKVVESHLNTINAPLLEVDITYRLIYRYLESEDFSTKLFGRETLVWGTNESRVHTLNLSPDPRKSLQTIWLIKKRLVELSGDEILLEQVPHYLDYLAEGGRP